jgi:hypothetical protein
MTLFIKTVRSLWLYLFIAHVLPAQTLKGWKPEKDKNGIQVYSQHRPNASLKDVKVVCQLPGSLAGLVALLSDVDRHSEWVYGTESSRLLRRVSETEIEFYSTINVPWPVEDRDLVVRLVFNHDPVTKILYIRASSVPDLVPSVAGKIRIPYSQARWTVKPLANQQLAIEYTFSADPGGQVPVWLVNLTAATGPYQSFLKLKELLPQVRYQNQQYDFLQN